MIKRMPCVIALLILAPVLLLAEEVGAKAVAATVCEITKQPAVFDGKMVRVRATVVSGFEVFGIGNPKNDKCGLIWLTYAGGGPVASTSFGPSTPNLRRAPVKLREDAEMRRFKELVDAEMYPRERGNYCMGCNRWEVTATLTGRLDYAGKSRGFGHLNGYETQLVLEGVSDISAVDLVSKYDPNLFSPTPVRFPTAYLRGKLLPPNGEAIHGAQVTATSTDDVPLYLRDFTDWTDKEGGFKLDVPPGNYLIAVNRKVPPSPNVPYPLTYYPGTQDSNAATRLSLTDGQKVDDIVIHLPNKLIERRIPVKAAWPDDKPVEHANVWLAEVRNPTAVVGHSVSHTDKEGIFDLVGFQGIDYIVHANIYVKPYYKPYCAEKVTIRASDKVKDRLVMVLTRTGDVCKGDY